MSMKEVHKHRGFVNTENRNYIHDKCHKGKQHLKLYHFTVFSKDKITVPHNHCISTNPHNLHMEETII
jgi:hypothetical protein